MEIERINALANVVIAFSTFIGVGGATAYYNILTNQRMKK